MSMGIAGSIEGAAGGEGGGSDDGGGAGGEGGAGGGGAENNDGGAGGEGAGGEGDEGGAGGQGGEKKPGEAGGKKGGEGEGEPERMLAPDTYDDFEVEEGFEFEPEQLGRVTDIFKKGNLDQETAQALMTESIANVKEVVAGVLAQQETDKAEADKSAFASWDNTNASHPVLGGPRLEQSKTEVASAIQMLGEITLDGGEGDGGAEARGFFEKTGLDREPHIFQILQKAGALIGEASGGKPPNVGGGEDTRTPAQMKYDEHGRARDTKNWGQKT